MSQELELTLTRYESDEEGTFGHLTCGTQLNLHTVELPDKNNQRNVSCIPEGVYKVVPYDSPRFGSVFLVCDVKDRSFILFHSGNFAGDASKGYITNSEGCILPGLKRGILEGQDAVIHSRRALEKLKKFAPNGFTLKIVDEFMPF